MTAWLVGLPTLGLSPVGTCNFRLDCRENTTSSSSSVVSPWLSEYIPVVEKGLCCNAFTAICFTCRILGPNVLVCSSLETALQRLQEPPLTETVESAWVIGGSSVYKVCNYCMLSQDTITGVQMHRFV